MNLYAILMVPAVVSTCFAVENPSPTNSYVGVQVTLVDTSIMQGGKGKIIVAFAPIDGIHINADPPPFVKTKHPFTLEGKTIFGTDKETEYLSTSTPVEQSFAVARNARTGDHTLKGTLVYYFCSDTEGWCRKFTQPIELKLNVRKK